MKLQAVLDWATIFEADSYSLISAALLLQTWSIPRNLLCRQVVLNWQVAISWFAADHYRKERRKVRSPVGRLGW